MILSMVDVSTGLHHLSSGGPGSEVHASRRRRWASALIFLSLLFGFGLYAAQLPDQNAKRMVSIGASFTVSTDGRTLGLSPNAACLATITSVVDEGPTAVRVRVFEKGGAPDARPARSCRQTLAVYLQHPLGRRPVVDALTGKVVRQQ
jgi:hypothetical protein